jgi:hypothetical protein
MNEKYAHWLQGAAGGAILLAIVGFTWGGWQTETAAAERAQIAVRLALIPECVRDVMADSTSAEELKVKRASDYDDVVRDYRKRKGNLADHGFQFNRDCGKAIEAALPRVAPKS